MGQVANLCEVLEWSFSLKSVLRTANIFNVSPDTNETFPTAHKETQNLASLYGKQIEHQHFIFVALTTTIAIFFWLLDIGLDGITPDKVALPHQVKAVVGQLGTQAALFINKQRIQVNPGHALSASHLLE